MGNLRNESYCLAKVCILGTFFPVLLNLHAYCMLKGRKDIFLPAWLKQAKHHFVTSVSAKKDVGRIS